MPRSFSWNAYEGTLTSPITDTSTTITLDSTLGLRAPGYLVIEAESPTDREYIWFATINGSALEGVSRGLGGSIAGGVTHVAGVKMRSVTMHQMFDDLWDSIGTGGGNLQYHIEDDGDPHAAAKYLKQDVADSTYLLITDATSTYLPLAGGTMSGPIHLLGDGATALFFDDDDQTGFNIRQTLNGDLHFRRGLTDWMILQQSGATDEVVMNRQLDMSDREIRNVADPANSGAAMSRGYADARYVRQ